jgi:hypothetical protein
LDSRNANLNLQIATEAPQGPGFLRSHAPLLANLDSSDYEENMDLCLDSVEAEMEFVNNRKKRDPIYPKAKK